MALKDRANCSNVCAFGVPTNYRPISAVNITAKLFDYEKENGVAKKSVSTYRSSTDSVRVQAEDGKEITLFAKDYCEKSFSMVLWKSPSAEKVVRTAEDQFRSAHRKVQLYYKTIMELGNDILDERNYLYAFEKAREAASCPVALNVDGFEFRRSVIDEAMMYTAMLKEKNLPITRATLQLAVSLLDRTLSDLLSFKNSISLDSHILIALSLLSTAIVFEKSNGTYQVGCPIQKHILNELRGKYFSKDFMIFQKLQHYILDSVEYRINAPLCVEFAHYFMIELGYDLSRIADDTQLVAYLLDCFVIHDLSVSTPASKAAAAAVTLMRRIFNPQKPMNQLWTSSMIDVSGYCLRDLRPVLDAMNEMLLEHADGVAGLKALHRNGWADIAWKMPA